MAFQYMDTEHKIIDELSVFEKSIHGSLVESLWNFDFTQIEAILKGALSPSYVVGAEVKMKDNVWRIGFVQGENLKAEHYSKEDLKPDAVNSDRINLLSYKVDLKHQKSEKPIGVLILYSSSDVVFDQVKFGFILILLNAVIKTFALWVFFLGVGYLYLSKPLYRLTEATEQIAETETGIIPIRVPHNKNGKTEIDILANSFNHMMDKLDESSKNLMESNKQLSHTKSRLDNIINAMPSIIIGIDEEGIITDWNDEATKFSGVDVKEAMGKSIISVYGPFSEHIDLARQAIKEKKVQINPRVKIKIRNEEMYFDVVTYPIISENTVGSVIRIDDVTEEIRIEEMISDNERMVSMGSLAAGVANEINNPLGAIIQGVQNIQRRLDFSLPANMKALEECHLNKDDVENYLKMRKVRMFIKGVHDSGESAADVVDNLLKFTRKANLIKTSVHIPELIDRSLTIAKTEYRQANHIDFNHINIRKNYKSNVKEVTCCVSEIQQVILNILKNAAYSLYETEDNPEIEIVVEGNDNEIIMSFKDNGRGMDEETTRRAFEPFYTTKPEGDGVGLGLSVSYNSIVQTHKGTLSIESEEGKGTSVIITLPYDQGY